MTTNTKPDSMLPDYSQTGDLALKNQNTLRRLVGTLGILLPILVYLFLLIAANFSSILPSLSHYYFTRAASLFEIIVSLLAIFLLIYKGEQMIDYILSTIAGVSALLMLLFPTGNLHSYNPAGTYDAVAVTFFEQDGFRPAFHYACAALFLLSLAALSLFYFTKSSQPPAQRTREKKLRNRIYRYCGITMLLALCIAFLGFLHIISPTFYNGNNLTFWMEVISVEAFGVAWMLKGGAVLSDR